MLIAVSKQIGYKVTSVQQCGVQSVLVVTLVALALALYVLYK